MASNELSHSWVSSGSRSVSWAAMPSLIRLNRGADWSFTDAVKATPRDGGRGRPFLRYAVMTVSRPIETERRVTHPLAFPGRIARRDDGLVPFWAVPVCTGGACPNKVCAQGVGPACRSVRGKTSKGSDTGE